MSNNTMQSFNNNNSNNNSSNNAKPTKSSNDTMTRMHPSMKRPRAPIACYRCHHKKVRCDGEHPNCTRCLSTGVLCAYPSSRRSRNTQPTNVDPFIDNLSQLEARIRRIETDLESQRALVRTVCAGDNSLMERADLKNTNSLTSRMLKTEKDLQESRSIVAQLRLRGEQRAARGRRAAAAAAAAANNTGNSSPSADKNNSGKAQKMEAGHNTGKQRSNLNKIKIKKEHKPYTPNTINDTAAMMNYTNNITSSSVATPTSPFYFTSATSPTDFINPSPTYYFPTYSSSYTTDLTTAPICSTPSSSAVAPFAMTGTFQDWSMLNDLPHTPAPNATGNSNSNSSNNDFVDPMIIAAAEAHQHGIAPPLLSVSSYMVDEDSSIMAARARSLSHLPPTTDATMLIPGLQPSLSSTSTSSNSSFGFNANQTLYDGYAHLMENSGHEMMMIDGQQ